MGNQTLHKAKQAKNDDFYTQLEDIEKELQHYVDYFKDKVVYCNCDDPSVSNFFRYFSLNFEHLRLKKLITTCYKNRQKNLFSEHNDDRAIYLEYEGDKDGNNMPDDDEIEVKHLKGDGDFRSEECIELLKQADIVVTNPPFSLFREYIEQLMRHNKKFIVLGNKNAITYRETFRFIQQRRMWVGHTPMGRDMLFDVSPHIASELRKTGKEGSKYRVVDGVVRGRAPSTWFTNLDHDKRHEELILDKKYAPEKYPKYDNYDAINVNKSTDIPMDYEGIIGVPITFVDKYNPRQFEIVGIDRYVEDNPNYGKRFTINGKETYARILIRHKALKN